MIQKVSKRLFLLAALVALALSVIVPLSTPKAESKKTGPGYFITARTGLLQSIGSEHTSTRVTLES